MAEALRVLPWLAETLRTGRRRRNRDRRAATAAILREAVPGLVRVASGKEQGPGQLDLGIKGG